MTKMSRGECKKATRIKAKMLHLAEAEGIRLCETPTQHLMIWNVGLMTGASRELLRCHFEQNGASPRIAMLPQKQYSFLSYDSAADAQTAYDRFHGEPIVLLGISVKMKMVYVEKVPDDKLGNVASLPPGLEVRDEYIDEEYEAKLLRFLELDGSNCDASMKHRHVKHYGYRFNYKTNDIDKDPLKEGMPDVCQPLLNRLLQDGLVRHLPDQLTINTYEPGQGIPPHVDTHSAFEDGIVSLSLSSATVMDFRHPDGRHYPLELKPRSVIVMMGESRYVWSHGITPRKTDVVHNTDEGITLQERGMRVSFTFRKVTRNGKCACQFPQVCDGRADNDRNKNLNEIDLEKLYVQQVYEAIAIHFDHTRHTPWPRVAEFLQSLPPGSFVVDVGCGNGKYFKLNETIFEVGFDRSESLMDICHRKGHEVFCGDIMHIPMRDGIADACICIAVIHHLASETRRQQAVNHIISLLRPGGCALIYVWAMEQETTGDKSNYVKNSIVNSLTTAKGGKAPSSIDGLHSSLPFPVHVNRTQFEHQDILVPWHLKKWQATDATNPETVHHRYYHLFRKGELEHLCTADAAITVERSYYDKGNWCVVLKKKSP